MFPDAEDPNDPVAARERELMEALAGDGGEAPLTVKLFQREGVPVVQLQGELELCTAALFRERLDEALAQSPRALVVDLGGLAYLDSSGLNQLLRVALALKGTLHVVSPKDRVTRLFQATGLSKRMKVHRSLPEALLHVALNQ